MIAFWMKRKPTPTWIVKIIYVILTTIVKEIVIAAKIRNAKKMKKVEKKILLYIYPNHSVKRKVSQVLLYFYILNSIKQANLFIKVPDLLFYFTFYIILSRNIVLILHIRSGGHYLTSIRLNSILNNNLQGNLNLTIKLYKQTLLN
jgi:hypothetical protein